MSKKRAVDLVLDSGAYSAWTKGESINLKNYIAFLKEHEPLLESYVSLDVIPGKHGKPRSLADTNKAAGQSHRNHQIMKDAGLHPMPVFHQGESFKWLETMMKDGEPYIGISPLASVLSSSIRRWLDNCFSIITDAKGRPVIRAHGFGVTQPALLTRYPFATADSTTWAISSGYGLLFVPPLGKDGKFDYLTRPVVVVMSGRFQDGGNQARQFEALTPAMRDHVQRYLMDEAGGYTLAQGRYDAHARARALTRYFMKLADALVDVRFDHSSDSLVDILPPPADAPAVKSKFKVIFATNLEHPIKSEVLNDCNARDRLLSYYFLRDASSKNIEAYVMNGIVPRKQIRRVAPTWSEQYLTYRRMQLVEHIKEYEIEPRIDI